MDPTPPGGLNSLAYKRLEEIAEFVPSFQHLNMSPESDAPNMPPSRWNVDSSVFVPGGGASGSAAPAGIVRPSSTGPAVPGPVPHMSDGFQPKIYSGPPSPQKAGYPGGPNAARASGNPSAPTATRPNPGASGSGFFSILGQSGEQIGSQEYGGFYPQQGGHQRSTTPIAQLPPNTDAGRVTNFAGIPLASQPVTQPGRRQLHTFFISESLRADLQKRTVLLLRGSNPDDLITQGLPQVVHKYHSLYPLEDASKDRLSKVFNLPSFCYKAVSIQDGKSYVLRKVDNFRISNEYAQQTVDIWKSLIHPGIIGLKDVFVSPAFNNINSLFFVYEYHPGAETIEQKFPATDKTKGGFVSEDMLWSFIIQIVSALKVIHSHGLAARVIVPSKILITGKNRIRLSCVGMEDLLNFDARRNTNSNKQVEDVINLGALIVRLACAAVDPSNLSSLPRALESVAATYSSDLHTFLLRLLGLINPNRSRNPVGTPPTYPSLDEILQMLAPRMLTHMDRLNSYTDVLESELTKDMENGRLFRLMVKLGFVNERPEYDMTSNWSETGDRYLLKLFRDYVFHQVDEDGTPVLDLSHVVECLNKLDVGVDEKVLLMSRDEKSMLIVSYKDLRRCLAEAFNELVAKQQIAQQNLTQPNSQPPNPAQGSTTTPGGLFIPGSQR